MIEIFLNKKYVSTGEWQELIMAISKYNGIFGRWKILVIKNESEFRYYIDSKRWLPIMISDLSSFVLCPCDKIVNLGYSVSAFCLPKQGNIIDLVNECRNKRRGIFERLEISFRNVYADKMVVRANFYVRTNDIVNRYRMSSAIPADLLSVNFESNKAFSYKKPPVSLRIGKAASLLKTESNYSLLKINSFLRANRGYYLNQKDFNFDRHSVIIGSSGCGKSKFISLFIDNIYEDPKLREKYKVVVIDPHAALEQDIGGLGKVIDFQSSADSVDLFAANGENVVVSIELLLDLLKSIMADQYNSKVERVLRHATYVLLANGTFCFTSLRRLITDLEFRNELVAALRAQLPISVIDFFMTDFNDLKTKSYNEAISPIISFIDEMEMIPVLGGVLGGYGVMDVVAKNFLTVFSLDRMRLGNKATKMIAGLVMQQLFMLAQDRVFGEHIILVVDEVAVIENPILRRFLSEARKYNFSLVLAGQYFGQISDELKSSIFANVINYFVFRVSKIDASVLVDCLDMKIDMDDSREERIKLLTDLGDRECVARVGAGGVLIPACKGTTLDYVSKPRAKDVIQGEFAKRRDDMDVGRSAIGFSLDCNINQRELLMMCSSSRKDLKHER